ncbi:MAG: nucleotidyltransferase domain-containing protein [Pirellulaceae bacterium]
MAAFPLPMLIGTSKLSPDLESRIRNALAPLHPKRVILFGSYAWGDPTPESDVDLYVVTQDDFTPATYEESMENYLKVSSLLRDIKKSVPIDLIVHTRSMHEEFIRADSMFCRAIMNRGKLLYENDI